MHIAITMDGNGRWASQRSLPRVAGHKVGVDSVRAIVKASVKNKVDILTLFAFSTENWQRPEEEVSFLMEQLFAKLLDSEIHELHQNNINLIVIGDVASLSEKLQQKINKAEELTKNNTGLKLVIALSYSGRWDIVNAARKIGLEIESGKLTSQNITIELFNKYVALSSLPEPDLLIRTSGELRISNFMLWQLAYTELYFTQTLWPDFREEEFEKAILEYQQRSRRFGKC